MPAFNFVVLSSSKRKAHQSSRGITLHPPRPILIMSVEGPFSMCSAFNATRSSKEGDFQEFQAAKQALQSFSSSAPHHSPLTVSHSQSYDPYVVVGIVAPSPNVTATFSCQLNLLSCHPVLGIFYGEAYQVKSLGAFYG